MEISGYRITTDPADFDLDAIHGFIGRSYWAAGMPKALLAKAIANSLCFGILADSGEQVGFARVVTDYATFGYLSDVYVLEQHRGKGLSTWLMTHIMQHPELQGLRRFKLVTADAHGLYAKFGFTAPARPERIMEIFDPDVYRRGPR
jgi:GNAT superfamily N-acetyltransferase